MNDEQLQREIEEVLSAEPSPQFIARMRRQIAATPLPSRRFHWILLTAGVAAAALVGILMLQPWAPQENLLPENAVITPRPEPEVLNPGVAAPLVEPPSHAPAVPKVASQPARPKPSEPEVLPEVLIDAREARAFQNFVEAVEKQNIDPSRLQKVFEAAERTHKQDIAPMPLAGLEPIKIEPLSPAAPERGNL